ncbi:MAG: UDP-N-acetylmuramoyl-tripeptide--D-alanyl-D-alanine ligase [Acidobacteria bacterium]|nr:UDP-N-acetylmuramoyl-tripeptide--D-alanyl-D-alanine ligase [Acidobacteriota bacterium]
MQLSAAWVASAAGGTLASGAPGRLFDGVSIDTRTLRPGALYVALRGERFDGAGFAVAALAAGAGGILVPAGWSGAHAGAAAGEAAIVEAADTLAALQALGRAVRRASGARVVAITGSAGKTTTKEITADLLSARYRVMRNRGNLNNHIGLPLSLTELTARPDVAVVELGMSHAGEIRTLVGIAEPEVRVWTNVGEAHAGFFASIDAIADAKAEILEGASPETLLVANADDPRIMARIDGFAGRVVTFGIDRDADVRARRVVDRGIDGIRADVSTPHGGFELATPLAGRASLANVLAAAAVASELDVPPAEIAGRAARLHPASHRGEVVRLAGGVTLIDDSYNANPTATLRALEVLAASPAAGRRVAVLGEMLELGAQTIRLHEAVGRSAAGAADFLFTIGGAPAAAMAEAAVRAGLAPERVRHAATSDEAAALVSALIGHGDLVLVKGSRGIGTDRVVDRIAAENR